MRFKTALITILAALLLAAGGCKEEGAMEKMGKKLDEAAEEAQDAAEDAAKELEKAAEELEDASGG